MKYQSSLAELITNTAGCLHIWHDCYSREEWMVHYVVACAIHVNDELACYVVKQPGFVYHDGSRHVEMKRLCDEALRDWTMKITEAGREVKRERAPADVMVAISSKLLPSIS